MDVKKIGVIGAGQMGAGIAQVAAGIGMEVFLNDISDEFIGRGIERIRKDLGKLVAKGKMAQNDLEAQVSRIRKAARLEDLAGADFIVEAATEREDLKLSLFRELDRVARPGVILATNTSSIPITRIAGVTRRPELVIGMHFMNPVPVMKLVEIINGLATSAATTETTVSLAERMGKTVAYSSDFPGFIVNRILMPMINEAIYALYEGVGDPEDIDTAMKLGTNQPMGPLALADLIGLDTCLAIMDVLHRGHGDKYRPCPLLRQYVDAGWLGRKVRRGFYKYEA
ncbi:MAG: 3-hydroxybutyryl-CoA dehydrogenase [Myxococcales bacterium]|nr:3-hydroxybutyryl-CoA dehydrogenase [Myxococcales bacterium]